MGDVLVGVTDQAAGAGVVEVRTRERTAGGPVEQFVIPVSERVASFKGMATTFRIPGNATTAQNLFSIENAAGSGVLVAVRHLSVQMDATAVLTAVTPAIKASRITTAPTGGTAMPKFGLDSAQSSSASVTARGGASADGTAAAITATPGNAAWQSWLMRLHTAVGQVLMPDDPVIPDMCDQEPIILRAGEYLLAALVAAAGTSNPATNAYAVSCMWEEFLIP